MSKAPLWLVVLFPAFVHAEQSTCNAQECSASVSANFKIVIPEFLRVRVDEDGTVTGSVDSGRRPVKAEDEDGTVTISFP